MRSIEWVNQLPGLLCSSHFIYIEHVSGESSATVVENFACICPGCTKISAYDKCLLLKHEPGVSWRIRVSVVCQTQGYMEAARAFLYKLIDLVNEDVKRLTRRSQHQHRY